MSDFKVGLRFVRATFIVEGEVHTRRRCSETRREFNRIPDTFQGTSEADAIVAVTARAFGCEDPMRALVVEDEKRLGQNIAAGLRQCAGYAVDLAEDGNEGLFMAENNQYDLVVLDLMLPKLPGSVLLEKYRESGHETPVLILTARDDKQSIIKLLNAGADDYLSKPFDLGELLARAKALVRRGKGKPRPVLCIGDLEINLAERVVKRAGKQVEILPMEYRLLEYLASRSPAVVSKTELMEHLYDYNWEKFGNVIEVYIWGLRKKIDAASKTKLIHTLRGHGYTLRIDADTEPGQ